MLLPYTLNKKLEWLTILLMLANVAASFAFYAHFPGQVPTHFNIAGEPDQYSGKAFAAFFFPALIVGLYLLLTFLPLIDPRRERYQEFSRPYQIFRFVFVVYLSGLYAATSLYALGYPLNIADISTAGIGVLFLILGNFMPKFKTNWFVGIRTPWTLSDEEIWQKTHRVGGKIFVAGGLLLIVALFAPASWRWVLLMVFMAVMLVGTVGYSYYLWRKKQRVAPLPPSAAPPVS